MMNTATIQSCTLIGVVAEAVDVCCAVSQGPARFTIDRFTIDGTSRAGSKESSVRVRSALAAAGHPLTSTAEIRVRFERDDRLGPARVPTAALDLATVLAVLAVLGTIDERALAGILVVGELALDGKVRPVRGVLAAAEHAARAGMRGVLVPEACAWEASLVEAVDVHPVADLAEIVAALRGERPLRTFTAAVPYQRPSSPSLPDFSDVRGHAAAIEAVATAALAHQGILLVGPPGTGKTMLARRAATVLPELTLAESIEVTRAYSALGLTSGGLCWDRPFRAPHHTISTPALVGDAGPNHRPGEIQLAAYGVLFLDEISEFAGNTANTLQAALGQMSPESRPLIVASATPCPCGWRGYASRTCACSPDAVGRHEGRVAGFAAMLGLTCVEVPALREEMTLREEMRLPAGESSAQIRARLTAVATPASTAVTEAHP